MATLVFNAVGTALGGPVGGAIGSLLGQSIDQQLLGPGARRGPRLADLSVQTSSYGAPIPQIFGTMRAAGTIVWATDLEEQSNTQAAKGQPDTITYTYSVSLAVALSSRPIEGIGRIWADGKLIRSSDGEFSVRTDFRICDGSEEQPVDPLIASIEGSGSTPAYRGLALALFENLELADFGNRIPFLTFEVIADPGEVAAGSVMREASSGLIDSSDATSIIGYAVHGQSLSSAVEPLVQVLGIPLADDGLTLSSPSAQVTMLDEGRGGCGADEKNSPAIERSRESAASVATAVSISYYDPDRDYQAGVAKAAVDASRPSLESVELPAVLAASAAKAIAQSALARGWAERDQLTLRLPPDQLSVRPGSLVQPSRESGVWRVEQVTIDSLAVILQLRPASGVAISSVRADPGRIVPSTPVSGLPTSLSLVELPDDGTGAADSPLVVAAAAGGSPWRGVPLQVDAGGAVCTVQSARQPAIIGSTLAVLEAGQSRMFDLCNSVDVQLEDADAWLESRDDDALAVGANLAAVGSELIQFGDAMPIGEGVFRLSRLLRGRRGTEWAMAGHSAGETFTVLEASSVAVLPVTRSQTGARLSVTPQGLADTAAEPVEITVGGEALKPPSPVHLRAVWDAAGTLSCSWTRRSHGGWDWLDAVDAPLGCAVERYIVSLAGSTLAIGLETNAPSAAFDAAQVASTGPGELVLTVVQVGDYAASRPAILTISRS